MNFLAENVVLIGDFQIDFEMEDWEALAYENDFESRYADELELLDELDGQFNSQYSLN